MNHPWRWRLVVVPLSAALAAVAATASFGAGNAKAGYVSVSQGVGSAVLSGYQPF